MDVGIVGRNVRGEEQKVMTNRMMFLESKTHTYTFSHSSAVGRGETPQRTNANRTPVVAHRRHPAPRGRETVHSEIPWRSRYAGRPLVDASDAIKFGPLFGRLARVTWSRRHNRVQQNIVSSNHFDF